MDRRTFLATGSVLGGSLFAGCTGLSAPQNTDAIDSEPQSTTASTTSSLEAWTTQMNNYDGVVDRTGRASVTIDVGVEADDGTYFAFGPATVRVSPRTRVTWQWLGNGGSHNVHAVTGANFESETTATAGYRFKQMFESERTITYQCDPHTSIGMKGVILVREDS